MTKELYVYEDGNNLVALTDHNTGYLLDEQGLPFHQVKGLKYGEMFSHLALVGVLYDPVFDSNGALKSISGMKIEGNGVMTPAQLGALKNMIEKQSKYHVVMTDSYGDEWGFVEAFGLIIPQEAAKDEYYTFDTKEEAEKYLIPGAYLVEV